MMLLMFSCGRLLSRLPPLADGGWMVEREPPLSLFFTLFFFLSQLAIGLRDCVKRYTWLERRYCLGPSMIPGPLFSSSSSAGRVTAAAVVGETSDLPPPLFPPLPSLPPCSLCFSNHAADVPDG